MAANTLDHIEKNHLISAFDDGSQNSPFLLKEISIGEGSQTISPSEFFGLGLNGTFTTDRDLSFAGISCLYNSSYFLQDKRELIFLYLFPFHFFW
jgi:hypothetical protein